MKISKDWLFDFIDLKISDEDLISLLINSGFEVEETYIFGEGVKGVIAVKVVDSKPHPGSNNLKLLKVTDGKGTFEIVCGDLTVKEGDVCPFAPPGATIKGEVKVEKKKIKGVLSNGMLCSAEELGIEEKSEGVMKLNPPLEPGADIVKHFGLGDFIMDVAVTPQRGDVLSHFGLAREISSLTGANLKVPPANFKEYPCEFVKDVLVENPFYCRRYTGKVIFDLNPGESPWWMKMRLIKAGLRPISNIVDVTNYVLLELGQPLHAFDFHKVKGNITVRFARAGERIHLLDGTELTLFPDDLVIADENSPIALAGVMGGFESAVDGETRVIFLESACFHPGTVRKTSKRHRITTESSYRFERKVDPEGVEFALRRAVSLFEKVCGGKASLTTIDIYQEKFKSSPIVVSKEYINKVSGISFRDEEVEEILRRFNFIVKKEASAFRVFPPSYRMDVEIPADVVEELVRVKGYRNIPEKPLRVDSLPLSPFRKNYFFRELRYFLRSLGFFETLNYIFTDLKGEEFFFAKEELVFPIKLDNPLTMEEPYLRMNILSGLFKAIAKNERSLRTDLRFFEMGKVFFNQGGAYREFEVLGIAASGKYPETGWYEKSREVDFYFIKGLVTSLLHASGIPASGLKSVPFSSRSGIFHPGKACALLDENKEVVAVFGEINPLYAKKLEIDEGVAGGEVNLGYLLQNTRKMFGKTLYRFPPVIRDLSLVVFEDVNVDELTKTLRESSPDIVSNIILYDVYRGPQIENGKMSLTFRIWFRSEERTLSNEEVSSVFQKMVEILREKFSASLR